ncbi:MAG TPA: hypothetical protein VFL66_13670 [Gaiellaceae bacterium]|nr:hypothetical protein [Gaiellaceae bacterium]
MAKIPKLTAEEEARIQRNLERLRQVLDRRAATDERLRAERERQG